MRIFEVDKPQTLFLIRGVPGSGKSTVAKKLLFSKEADVHLEADMYFVRNGKYEYIPERIKDAHQWCLNSTYNCLKHGKNVVVSNTFIKKDSLDPYIKMARRFGAKVDIRNATGNYGSIHNVPDEVIQKMKNSWED